MERVALFTKIKLRNSASCWLLLQEYITMHGPLNVKVTYLLYSHPVVTRLRAERPTSAAGARDFSPKCPDRLWSPPASR